MGRSATPQLNERDDALTVAFYNEPRCVNKQVKTFLCSRKNTDASGAHGRALKDIFQIVISEVQPSPLNAWHQVKYCGGPYPFSS
jgi:hypothetical protein